jgi:hypothetical protein
MVRTLGCDLYAIDTGRTLAFLSQEIELSAIITISGSYSLQTWWNAASFDSSMEMSISHRHAFNDAKTESSHGEMIVDVCGGI